MTYLVLLRAPSPFLSLQAELLDALMYCGATLALAASSLGAPSVIHCPGRGDVEGGAKEGESGRFFKASLPASFSFSVSSMLMFHFLNFRLQHVSLCSSPPP